MNVYPIFARTETSISSIIEILIERYYDNISIINQGSHVTLHTFDTIDEILDPFVLVKTVNLE